MILTRKQALWIWRELSITKQNELHNKYFSQYSFMLFVGGSSNIHFAIQQELTLLED